LRRTLTFAPLRWAGVGCYSLYLVQGPLMVLVVMRSPAVLLRTIFLLLVFGVSFVTYRFVEKPWMSRGRRLADRLARASGRGGEGAITAGRTNRTPRRTPGGARRPPP
jgi:peptidoglycan/LPS O-acetylase OafA/YrhL